MGEKGNLGTDSVSASAAASARAVPGVTDLVTNPAPIVSAIGGSSAEFVDSIRTAGIQAVADQTAAELRRRMVGEESADGEAAPDAAT